jgi:hypothetical protein
MSAFTKQFALLGETAAMAFDTIRGNKMRSALTVLGVVIGVTSIVGMTSLIRGFDTSLRESINSLGPNTIFVQKFGAVSMSSGASFMQLMRRPNLTVDDMKAVERLSTTAGMVDVWLGGAAPDRRRRSNGSSSRNEPGRCDPRHDPHYVEINFGKMHAGPVVLASRKCSTPARSR